MTAPRSLHRPRCPRINLQGSLANPNLALQAAQAGTLDQLPPGPTGRIDARSLADARASGLTGLCITLGHVVGPGDAWAMTCTDLTAWQAFARHQAAHLRLARTGADLHASQADGRLAVILGVQNTEMLGTDPDTACQRIAHLTSEGLGVVQLTYNGPNAIGCGCLSPGLPHEHGLTALGHQAVAALNDARVLIDLSHAAPRTLGDAVAASRHPVAVTHTGCRALVDNPRNLWDADLRRVAEHGGVIGLYAMPFLRASGQPGLDDWVRHIEHAWRVAGTEHVGVGTDGTITAVDDVALYLRHLAEAVQARRLAGVAAPGEDGAVALFLPDAAGPGQWDALALCLSQRGHAASAVDKLLGGNAGRLLEEVWPAGPRPESPS